MNKVKEKGLVVLIHVDHHKKVSYAANFGGLVRMLKTNNSESRSKFRELRRDNRIVDEYVSFIHRNSKLHFRRCLIY